MSSYLYSFIIPHKNSPDLIRRCVDSIPQRDDIQIIVVDDNSDDDKKPCLERAGLEIVLLDAEHSKGAGRARNVGLAKAMGKWILFADADDFYKKDFLNILDKYSSEDFEVLYFNAESVNSETLEPAKRTSAMQSYFEKYDGDESCLKSIKYGPHYPWNKMVRLNFLKKWNISFEEVPKGNDTLYSYSVGYLASSVKIEKQSVYVYTWTKDSLTTQKLNEYKWLVNLKNLYKQNYFLKYVDCSFLCKPLIVYVWRIAKKKGVKNIFLALRVFVSHYISIRRQSSHYVEFVKMRKA